MSDPLLLRVGRPAPDRFQASFRPDLRGDCPPYRPIGWRT
ncbi:hypothetical protein X805_23240 [Sphaerotilus natans subsp. natans DSM 6575]|uniref:Uncharacterized protein n=1 Tax=Sphaerotilus natans subsp. natans DSM 6575 TaxID=1286631 RepID=A0A059KL40_9BURK|nr:hypothetical protein X805_23240 [Sphaerotilus natans subsp. natans DSM 6575]